MVFSAVAVAEDSYNQYRGLGVEPREGRCELIVAHIKSVLCDNDLIAGEAMLDLMAWQLQHIGEPSRVIVMLHNPNQQAGKGVILEETLLSIYGPRGLSPSSIEQLLGRFNDSIRGRAYLFCDEVLFAGDLKGANALKALSTTTKKGIETKNLPVVECPLGVNLWLASNNENPIHIEEGDARYWVLRVNEDQIGDGVYFDKLLHEIKHGGREAFAQFLLDRDVSDFVPKRDVPRHNEERAKQIIKSWNSYDARVWLWDCATVEEILGLVISGQTTPWEAGAEVRFADLVAAYTNWQMKVKSRAAPRPTKPGNLGEVLTLAGFEVHKTNSCNMRMVPTAEACLAALNELREWTGPGHKKG